VFEAILRFAVRRRALVVLLTAAAAGLGVVSLRRLSIDAVPDITNNQVTINTFAPSRSPVEIEKQVTFPIETALAGIPGLQHTRSLSRNGFSQITAVFDDEVDVYFARNQVNERLQEVRGVLPEGAEPALGPISTGLGEIYMWTVDFEHPDGVGAEVRDGAPGWQADGSYRTPEGERLTSAYERTIYLRTLQDWLIRPQLRAVDGVAGVDSMGGYVKQYVVEPDPMKLVSYGLSFADLIAALERNNVSTGAGLVEHGGEARVVRISGRIGHLSQIEDIAVGSRGGVPIHVHDVARVALGHEPRSGSASENGHEVVLGTVLMRIGANSRNVSAAVDAKMAEIRRALPPDVRVKTVLDRRRLVDATVRTVAKNLAEGALLVIVVLFALLGNLRAAFICALAIPLSMLFTAVGMVQAGISGNLMSLGAIDFGLIVDGAVIVVENCLRRLGERQHALGRVLTLKERLAEVTRAAREMIQPSVYGQAIIVTVYVPILALTGVEGKMFHPMATTVIFALASAFLLSLTLVPALVALLMRGRVRERENALVQQAKRLYEPILRWALRRRLAVAGGATASLLAALALGRELGEEFAPTLDEHDLVLMASRIPSTSLSQATALQRELEEKLAVFPEVSFVFSRTGTADIGSDPMPPNLSDTFVILEPRASWPDPGEPKEELRKRLEAAAGELRGNQYEWTQPIQMRFNELLAGIRGDVAVKVFGYEFPALRRTAGEVARVLEGIEGAVDIKVEATEGLPVVTVDVDRAMLARHGLSAADVQDVVSAAVGGRVTGQVFEGDRRFDLVVRLSERTRGDLEALASLPVPIPSATDPANVPHGDELEDRIAPPPFLPLWEVARVDLSEGPNQVSRENGKRRLVVQCNVRGRDLGSFVAEAQERVAAVAPPPGGWLAWGGQFENLVTARERLALVVPLCFLLILLLLYGTFSSWRYALLVFTGVPLGWTGGILSLAARGMPFSISAAVGFIALSGVAVLNGLVLVSAVHQLRGEGLELEEAIRRGALARIRPVLTTALVASLGFLPMALAIGAGAEVQRPLATVVVGGLISSTFLTLLVLPGLYRTFAARVVVRAPGVER
jgi:cobalt-zinc-cadmium resistance protein CzcA